MSIRATLFCISKTTYLYKVYKLGFYNKLAVDEASFAVFLFLKNLLLDIYQY